MTTDNFSCSVKRWFPNLPESDIINVHTYLKETNTGFSAATGFALKQYVLKAMARVCPNALKEFYIADKANTQGYLDGFARIAPTSNHPSYSRSYAMGQRHSQGKTK